MCLGLPLLLSLGTAQSHASHAGVDCRGVPVSAHAFAGDSGPNTMNGGAEDEVFNGKGGDDTINGGGGNDIICGGEGADTLRGQAGIDAIFGDDNADTIYGGSSDSETGTGADTKTTVENLKGSESTIRRSRIHR